MEKKFIDISAWQEDVDWEAVKADGVEGVILKIGEYENLDEMFIEHVNNAVKAGIPYGIYYYAHAKTIYEADDEADWVDQQIKIYLNGVNPQLGIWYDAEDDSMRYGNPTACVSRFISNLNAKGYNYVGLYSGWNWLSKEGAHVINLDELADYVPLWVAQYNRYNDLMDEYPNKCIKMWQHTDRMKVAGIGYIDGDVYYE